jgi:hypothetical protein
MASSRMLRRVALVRTDVSEERSAPIIRVMKIGAKFLRNVGSYKATRRNISEDATLYKYLY